MKKYFQFFTILTMAGIGIYASYRYVQWLLKDDISLTIGIMAGSTVVFAVICFVAYKIKN